MQSIFRNISVLIFLICGVLLAANAQDSFISRWQARATQAQSEQPHWVTPPGHHHAAPGAGAAHRLRSPVQSRGFQRLELWEQQGARTDS
jgi:hypothetical protein